MKTAHEELSDWLKERLPGDSYEIKSDGIGSSRTEAWWGRSPSWLSLFLLVDETGKHWRSVVYPSMEIDVRKSMSFEVEAGSASEALHKVFEAVSMRRKDGYGPLDSRARAVFQAIEDHHVTGVEG